MAHWLVQSNPAKWRVREFFADGNQLENWSITRYRDQIQEGEPPVKMGRSLMMGDGPAGWV